MDEMTQIFKAHYERVFKLHGATAKGVDWNDEREILVRYDKMLAVLQMDFVQPSETVSILDVGCGWGGLLGHVIAQGLEVKYTGIDVVESMIEYGRTEFKNANFIHGDIFDFDGNNNFDFVVCNGILTQKLSATIPEMEQYTQRLVRKMYEQCRQGIAFNLMSTHVNFMANNLFYKNPAELLTWLLMEVSPRVRIDHGYSSLASGKGKFFDFTAYVYKD